MLKLTRFLISFIAFVLIFAHGVANAQDNHEGYYYPKPQSTEIYEARIDVLPEANRGARIAFIVGITTQAMSLSYPPRFAVFAKGGDAEKLIIIGQDGEVMNTLYRMRAVLAQMTAMARITPIFQELDKNHELTVLDMLFLLGFSQVTLSDGDKIAHQILLN